MTLHHSIISGMTLALDLAKKASLKGEVPVGAVIMFQNKVIGKSGNLREINSNPFGHAEILAMRAASKLLQSWRLQECKLIVTLEPCLMCLASCLQARIHEVIYASADPKGGALSLGYLFHQDKRLNHRFPVSQYPDSIIRDKSRQLLKDFFEKRRRRV